jgi:urease accessory protein
VFADTHSMTMTDAAVDEIFAANRAVGRIALSAHHVAGASRPARVHEAGMLRVRFPHGARRDMLDAVIVNTAGGLAGGDRAEIAMTASTHAQLTVTTAAAEKIYRSLGPATQIAVKLEAGPGAAIAWLPQETILFDRMHLQRTIDVALARDASLVMLEAVVFGRCAMGERVTSGCFLDRWRVCVDGALVFADAVRLDGEIAKLLERRAGAGAGAGVAVATVLKIPGDEQTVAAVRAVAAACSGEVGVSTWNGLMIGRLVAPTDAALRGDLLRILTALGTTPPRLWLN